MKGGVSMNTAKQILLKLLEEMSENEVGEVIDFIGYLKQKRDNEIYKDLEKASESSLDFWNNEIDDEVWNNV